MIPTLASVGPMQSCADQGDLGCSHLAGHRAERGILCETELCAGADVHHTLPGRRRLDPCMEHPLVEVSDGA